MSVLVPNITLAQMLGVQAIAYDTRKFNWIGRIIATTATLFTWHTSATKTLADLKTRETLVASTGPLSQAEINSTMLNGVVGTKFKLIRGYKGSGEAALAVERGEADGTLMPWEFLKAAHADWIKDGKISIVARYVRRPIPERPDVPSVYDLAETQRAAQRAELFLGADEMGHPIAMPPGVPRERVEAVRTGARHDGEGPGVPGGCREAQARPAARHAPRSSKDGGGGVRGEPGGDRDRAEILQAVAGA